MTPLSREPGEPSAAGSVKAVPIVWQDVEASPLHFSNAILVQHTDHEFVITFGFVQPPIVLAEGDAERITMVPAKAGVRIALPPTRAKELLDILTRNFNVYVEKIRSARGGAEGGSHAG